MLVLQKRRISLKKDRRGKKKEPICHRWRIPRNKELTKFQKRRERILRRRGEDSHRRGGGACFSDMGLRSVWFLGVSEFRLR